MKVKIDILITIFFSLVLCGCSSKMDEQIISHDPESFTVSSSISNLDINGFAEDEYGHVWIATRRGLNKYTGKDFYQYFRGDAPNTINNNLMNDIIKGRDGRLWIATSSGPCYYTENDDFHRIEVDAVVGRKAAYRIIQLGSGDVIMSNHYGDIFRYDEIKDRFLPLNLDEGFPIAISLYAGEGSSFWAQAMDKLYRIDSQGMGMAIGYDYPSSFQPSASVMDDKGVIWLMDKNSIWCFDTGKKSFVTTPSAVKGWTKEHTCTSMYFVKGYIILQERDMCWFYDMYSGDIISQNDSDSPYSLPQFRPTAFFKDSNGNLWVGSTGHGFAICSGQDRLFNRNHNLIASFSNVNIKSLDADSRDNLWAVATNNRLYRSSGDVSSATRLDVRKFVSDDEDPNSLSVIKYDPFHDKFWVGKTDALFLCRETSGDLVIEKTFRIPGTPNSIAIDEKGSAYVGTYSGDLVSVQYDSAGSFKSSVKHLFSRIRDVTFIGEQRLMILAMMEDVTIYNVNTGEKESIVYRDELGELFHLLDGCKDRFGNLWFVTQDFGLVRYNQFDGKFSIVPGTTCKTLSAVEVTDDDRIWVSSSFGLNMLTLESDNVVQFYEQDGIGGNQFNVRASCILSDGTVVFGGTHGITTCHRQAGAAGNNVPIYFENIEINGERVYPDEEGHFDRLLCSTPDIVLRHDDNNISVSFDALDYSALQTLQYQYKLEGYDKYWTFIGNNNKAHYSSLPAGRYQLKVSGKSIGNDPVYATLNIRVKPFILTSPGAYLCYLLVLALLGALVMNNQKRRFALRMQLSQSEREKEHERHVNNVNMNFFADMAHEFRSPLTMIQGPIRQLLETKEIGPDNYKLVSVMNLSVERMMKLVNQLLDFNKLDNDTLSLSVTRNTDIVSHLHKIVEMASVSAQRKGIEVRTFGMDSEFFMPLDSEKFESIMSNLMSNALKYAGKDGEQGHVEIHFQASDGKAYVMIDNNSPLLTEEELAKIFDRYYQVSEHAKRSKAPGTGIGLNFAHMLARRMYGDLHAENLPDGSGVRFILELPSLESAFLAQDFASDVKVDNAVLSEVDPYSDVEDDTTVAKNTILVVDDDVDIANYISVFLSPYYHVICANDVKSAMEYVNSENMPDVILSDIVMPDTDGISFCQSIKNNILTCHIPVILVTAKVGVKNEIQGLESGADAYVTKPFDPSYILALIKSMLKNRSLLKGELAKSTSVSEVQSTLLSKQDSEFLDKLYKIMEEEMSNPDLDVQKFCDKMFVSRTKLFYKVKNLTGMSVTNLFKTFRLNMAAKLLREGNDSVSDVAYKVGFSTPSYFTRAFKAQFGVLPKDIGKN